MTDHTNLIARLRAPNGSLGNEAADALEALQSELTQERTDYAAKCAELEIVHGDCDQLRAEVEAAKADIDLLFPQLVSLQGQRDALQARLTALESKEPIAYYDFQGKGFRWAQNVAIGDVPVCFKVEPVPLFAAGAAPTKCRTGGTP